MSTNKDEKNGASEEYETSEDSGMETDGDSDTSGTESDSEVVVTAIVTHKSLPPDISSSGAIYEFPDDSEFCESLESVSDLRKRPSDIILESTSKKPCSEVKTDADNQTTTEVKSGENKKGVEKAPDDSDNANNNNQVDGSQFLFGYKHKREGEKKKNKSENVPSASPSPSSGRFTKHKGDNKCHHGNFDDYSSDDGDADVEDNAEYSNPIIDTSREAPPKNVQAESSDNPFRDLVKRHIKTSSKNGPPKKDAVTNQPQQAVAEMKKTASSTTASGTVSKSGTSKGKKPANSETSSASISEASSSELSPPMSQFARQTRRRCRVCNKKLDLTAMHCRCGGLFCAKHRYDKEHDCTFDYRAMGAEEIRRNNPKVVGEKIRKI